MQVKYFYLPGRRNKLINAHLKKCILGIQDISNRSDLPRVLQRVEEKFRLDLDGK